MKKIPVLAMMMAVALLGGGLPASAGMAGTVPAVERAPGSGVAVPSASEEARASLLDGLFTALKAARSPAEARSIENMIVDVFTRSGSVTVDLLMARGGAFFAKGDFDQALFYFNEVVSLAPGYAEGWNRRAAIYFMRRDYGPALRDAQQALKIEPRDYRTMMGFAQALEDLDDRKGALEFYERALADDPWLDDAKAAVKRLKADIEGRGI